MSFKSSATSEFADAYKLKPSLDKKAMRLRRKSVDWKLSRQEETNKRRGINKFSPLQEISGNSILNDDYQGKTPVKAESKGPVESKKNAVDAKREQLMQWKKERELKRQLENENRKKPLFKVSHIERKDTVLFKHTKKANSAASKIEKPAAKITVTKKPSPAKGRVTRSQTSTFKPVPKASKTAVTTAKHQSKRPTTSTSTARQTTKIDRKPTVPSHASNKGVKKPATATAPSNAKNKTTKNGSNSAQKTANMISLDCSKVSCYRGESFAPEEFTFTAPSNISTFEFKPLSPASSANFLYPSDPSTNSFMQSEPKRCSTPKTAKIEADFLKQLNSNPVQHSPATKPPVSDVTLSYVSKETDNDTNAKETNDETIVCDNGETQNEQSDQPSTTKDNQTPSKAESVVDKNLTAVLNESRRMTRSLRRSLNAQEIQNVMQVDSKKSSEKKAKDSRSANESMDIDTKPKEEESEAMKKNESEAVEKIESEAVETKQNCDSISGTPVRLTRSVRRSLCIALPENSPSSNKKESQKKKSDESKEKVKSDVSTPRSSRRTMSTIAHDEFQIPNNTSLPLSIKRSQKKRRKTQYDTVPELKSPEEWIDLLKSSPMIEMNRRKTPSTSRKMPSLDLDMDIDAPVFPEVLPENLVKNLSFVDDKETPMKVDSTETKDKDNQSDKPEELTVRYFRNLLATEIDRMNNLSTKWETIKSDIPSESLTEEIEGQIRTVIGQAKLLISSKFKQFLGLIDDCEFNRGDKVTTCLDLQGFWEMMYSQVVDVDVKFCGLDKLKDNNWVVEKPVVTKKVVKKKTNPKPIAKPAVKSKFAAFRAQMKKNNNSEFPGPALIETKTFDAGIFTIVSPVKSPRFHCEAGSPKPKAAPSKEPVPPPVHTSCLPPAVEAVEPIIMTPKRKSYVPVVPSPLLVDTTPKPLCKRRSDMSALPKGKRICSDVKEESFVESEAEEKDDVFCEQPPAIATSSTRAKKTPRRSVRSRKSVSFSESFTTEPSQILEEDNSDWFNKFLQPTDKRVSVAPKETSVLDVIDTTDTANDTDPAVNSTGKRTRSLKELPSAQRRRSSRRISSIPSPVPENVDLHSSETINEVEVNSMLFTPPSRSSQSSATSEASEMSGRFSNLNVHFTPVSRKTRPSLLFTPPDSTTDITTSSNSNIPTDVLISFTP